MNMKVSIPVYTNQSSNISAVGKKSNVSFGSESSGIFDVPETSKCISTDIYGKTYRFILNDKTQNVEKLNNMIENIKKTLTGHFVRYDKHEYFIPHVLKEFPDILQHRHAVENGNAPIEMNEETEKAIDVFQAQTKHMCDIKNLKIIKYLRMPDAGYANNILRTAYSYFDSINNDLYLYMPHKHRLKVLTNGGLVKKIKI